MKAPSYSNYWKDVSFEEWTNWQWQLQHTITSIDELEKIINLSEDEKRGIKAATEHLKMQISPHVASMIIEANDSSLRKQFIPSGEEVLSIKSEFLFSDVNADNEYSPVPGLVHRYPSKVLIFPSNYCGTYCRYCFRRKLNRDVEETISMEGYEQIFNYIRNDTSIEEVILSGGDPLVLNDDKLEYIIKTAYEIPHVQIIRLHTRMPIVIPYRITQRFVEMLTKYKPVFVVIHIDTPSEISEQAKHSISQLIDNGIPCLASSPLLKGINDSEEVLRSLWTELIKLRVKPYYLFHSDPVKGLKHFVVPIKQGLNLMNKLYDRMSGLGIPHYCLNVPGGGGHVLLSHNYVDEVEEGHYKITTFEGNIVDFYEDLSEPQI